MRQAVSVLFVAVGTLLACNHADDVFHPESQNLLHIPRFDADRTTSQGNDVFITGSGKEDHRVTLYVRQGFTNHLWSGTLLLRVEAAGSPVLVTGGGGSWCSRYGAVVQPTERPGEWRITKIRDDLDCIFCSTTADTVATVELAFGTPGSWRVELSPEEGKAELCTCEPACSSSLDLFGGTVTNPP